MRYVRRFQETSARWLVSRGGGREARRAANEIFYRAGDSVMVVTVDMRNDPVIGAPRFLFSGSYASTAYEPLYDVSPDGARFAFVTNLSSAGTEIGMTLNWTARQRN